MKILLTTLFACFICAAAAQDAGLDEASRSATIEYESLPSDAELSKKERRQRKAENARERSTPSMEGAMAFTYTSMFLQFEGQGLLIPSAEYFEAHGRWPASREFFEELTIDLEDRAWNGYSLDADTLEFSVSRDHELFVGLLSTGIDKGPQKFERTYAISAVDGGYRLEITAFADYKPADPVIEKKRKNGQIAANVGANIVSFLLGGGPVAGGGMQFSTDPNWGVKFGPQSFTVRTVFHANLEANAVPDCEPQWKFRQAALPLPENPRQREREIKKRERQEESREQARAKLRDRSLRKMLEAGSLSKEQARCLGYRASE